MANYRGGRINEEVKREISNIIQNEIKDPRLTAMVSVTIEVYMHVPISFKVLLFSSLKEIPIYPNNSNTISAVAAAFESI